MEQFRSLGGISRVLGSNGPLHERIRARLATLNAKSGKAEIGRATLETWANESETMAQRIVELEGRLGDLALEGLEAKRERKSS